MNNCHFTVTYPDRRFQECVGLLVGFPIFVEVNAQQKQVHCKAPAEFIDYIRPQLAAIDCQITTGAKS